MTSEEWQALYLELATPFELDALFWRAGALSRDKKRAQALPYAEPRIYEDRLNELAPGAWGVTFKPWGENRIICELTIYDVTRSSTGEENDGFAPGTAAEAQAFKRACVKFGLGRYIYDIPIEWVSFNAERRVLNETPKLAAKFLPALPAALHESVLDEERVKKLRLELKRVGYEGDAIAPLIKNVLGVSREIYTLNEKEAWRVYAKAKNAPRTL